MAECKEVWCKQNKQNKQKDKEAKKINTNSSREPFCFILFGPAFLIESTAALFFVKDKT